MSCIVCKKVLTAGEFPIKSKIRGKRRLSQRKVITCSSPCRQKYYRNINKKKLDASNDKR